MHERLNPTAITQGHFPVPIFWEKLPHTWNQENSFPLLMVSPIQIGSSLVPLLLAT